MPLLNDAERVECAQDFGRWDHVLCGVPAVARWRSADEPVTRKERQMKIIVGADAWGVELKDTVKQHLAKHGHEVTDIGGTPGNDRPYYDVAKEAARMLQAGAAERAVLVCGTGMGMAIVANKFKGVYASVIESEFTARMCRAVNNANVLTMGSMVVAPYVAIQAVDAFLTTKYTQGLEDVADFLHTALVAVGQIEQEA